MKKSIEKWTLAIVLVCIASIFTSCKKENKDNPVSPTPSIAEQIVGKWLYIEADGEMVETSESSITNFVMEGSTLKAYTSISLQEYGLWAYNYPTDVLVEGNKLTLTMEKDDITTIEEFTDITVNGDELRYTCDYTILRNGEVIEEIGPYQLRCVKVHDDYSQIIIGKWLGVITSDEPGYVPQPFCEEYLADGTNIEYNLVDGEWVPVEADYAEYFVDGYLLCTRWRNAGGDVENREWWEITINGDTMNWTALREDENGERYTATFEMSRVF